MPDIDDINRYLQNRLRLKRTMERSVLPDYLSKDLDVVFVGTAAGDVSAERKHYYAGPNNSFYRCIYECGLVPVVLTPEDDWRLPEFGVGLTDIVKTVHTGDDSKLSACLYPEGASLLREKVLMCSPRIVCFNGKTAYTAFSGSETRVWGRTGASIGSSKVFVVPSTSGRVSADALFDGRNRLQWFEALAQLRDSERSSR